MTVKRRRDPPYATSAAAKFLLFRGRVFDESVRWIGDHGVNAVSGLALEPFKAVS
jgi:hypothetical protein